MIRPWDVGTYKEGDEQGILELMRLCGIERAGRQWFWEYKNHPFGHFIGVAKHNGQVVGHMALVPTYMKIGHRTTMGSQAVDLIVHPNFRRQGMFLALGKMLTRKAGEEGTEISYGFPNKPAHPGHLKYGWFDVCKVPQLIKPINTCKMIEFLGRYRIIGFFNRQRIARNVIRFILPRILTVISYFARIFNRTEEIENTAQGNLRNVEIHAIQSFDARIDEFWKEISISYQIIVARDKKYLNWRYFEKPNVKYTVLLAERNGEILGYAVLLSKIEKNLKFGYLVDLLVSLDSKDVIQSLILKAIEHLREENVDLIRCWMLKNGSSSHTYYKILKYNGFLHETSNPLIARVNSSQLSQEFLTDSKKWYITMGDSDFI